ncbi:unnamed protein product [Boreogadus saida]
MLPPSEETTEIVDEEKTEKLEVEPKNSRSVKMTQDDEPTRSSDQRHTSPPTRCHGMDTVNTNIAKILFGLADPETERIDDCEMSERDLTNSIRGDEPELDPRLRA